MSDDDEIDLSDLASAASPRSGHTPLGNIDKESHFEAETNVYSIEFDKSILNKSAIFTPVIAPSSHIAAKKTPSPINIDTGAFEIETAPKTSAPISIDTGAFEIKPAKQAPAPINIDTGVFEIEPATKTPAPIGIDTGAFEIETISISKEPPIAAKNTSAPINIDTGVFEVEPAKSAVPAPISIDTGAFEIEPATKTSAPINIDTGAFEIETISISKEPLIAKGPPPTAKNISAPISIDTGAFEIESNEKTSVPISIDTGAFEIEPATKTSAPIGIDTGAFEIESLPQTSAPINIDTGVFEVGVIEEKEEEDKGKKDVSILTLPPVFSKIAHVCLYVKNLDVSINYYTKLGFKKRFIFNKDGAVFGVYLEFGDGNYIELFEESAGADFTKGRIAHFCLETSDIDAVMRSLTERGIEYTPKKLGCDATYQIWLKDPDGNDFEVHQYTLDSSQITGKDVSADW